MSKYSIKKFLLFKGISVVSFNIIKRIQGIRAVHFWRRAEPLIRFSHIWTLFFCNHTVDDNTQKDQEEYGYTKKLKLKNTPNNKEYWDRNDHKKYKKPVPFRYLKAPSYQLSHHYSLKTFGRLSVFLNLHQPGVISL